MDKELVYYKLNVKYPVSLRFFAQDHNGILLTQQNSSVGVNPERLRDFKIANKHAILEGLIVPIDEPSVDWETPNALTDEDITELLKNYLKLKNALKDIDSVKILQKMLETAREQDRSEKMKNLISTRLEELTGDEILDVGEMQGVV